MPNQTACGEVVLHPVLCYTKLVGWQYGGSMKKGNVESIGKQIWEEVYVGCIVNNFKKDFTVQDYEELAISAVNMANVAYQHFINLVIKE
jgi:hypothetical protein